MPDHPLSHLLRVFVVDDDDSVREVLIEYFRSRGFEVDGARDGRAAITVLNRAGSRFGLILTDLNLPGADGFAVLQSARHSNPACFVVIVTGFASIDSAIQAVRVGAYDYLTKPFSTSQLEIILARIQERITVAAPPSAITQTAPPSSWPTAAIKGLEARMAAAEASIARLSEQLMMMTVRR